MYRIGIDLGGTSIKAGLLDESNTIIATESCKTNVERDWKEIIQDMAGCAQKLCEKAGIQESELEGIGVGSPGTIDANHGTVKYSNNFGWKGIPLVQELERYVSVPVKVSNDANCAALGEVVAGAAKGKRNVILLTLGTGIGSGIIVDGQIYEGSFAGAAEIGHTSLVMNGEPCTCGRKGCFEAYASATALIRQATRTASAHPSSLLAKEIRKNGPLSGESIFRLEEEGDCYVKEVIDDYIAYLACGVTNIINVFRCEMVILSGGICNTGHRILEPLNTLVRSQAFGIEKTTIAPVVKATLGSESGIVGAANLIESCK